MEPGCLLPRVFHRQGPKELKILKCFLIFTFIINVSSVSVVTLKKQKTNTHIFTVI